MVDFKNPYVILTTVFEYVAFFVICVINYNIFKRYKERKNNIAFLLLCAFCFFALAPILQSMDTFFLDTITLRELGYIASYGYASAMIMSAIANLFLFHFTYEVFHRSKSQVPSIIGFSDIFITILFFIYKVTNHQLTSTIIMGIHILLSFIIYFSMMYNSIISARKIDEMLNRRAFQLIGLTGLFLILMFVCFIIEAILFPGQFSIFGSIGWIFALIGMNCSYIGFILPPWFRKLYEGKFK